MSVEDPRLDEDYHILWEEVMDKGLYKGMGWRIDVRSGPWTGLQGNFHDIEYNPETDSVRFRFHTLYQPENMRKDGLVTYLSKILRDLNNRSTYKLYC